jgi:hypothetical protein
MSHIKILLTEGYIQFFSLLVYLESKCPTLHKMSNMLVDEEENQQDATQYVIELVIGSTCFGHHYAHRQER